MNPIDTKIPLMMGNTGRLQRAQKRGRGNDHSDVAQVAKDFEALFIEQLLKTMRQTIPEGGLIDGGQSEEIYTLLLDREVAQRTSERGIGLAEVIQRQLERHAPAHRDPEIDIEA